MSATRNLRHRIRERLVQLIVEGAIPAGSDLDEKALCERFRVSRTPVREALLSLEHSGLVESRPQRGWFVTDVTEDAVRETYPIIAALEVLSLRSSPPHELADAADDLVAINAELAGAPDATIAQAADDRWHERLLRASPNSRLRALVAPLKRAVHRYEYAFLDDSTNIARSAAQHDRITAAVRRGDIDRAAVLLEKNWSDTADLLLGHLATRDVG